MDTSTLLHALAPLLGGQVLGCVPDRRDYLALSSLRAVLSLREDWHQRGRVAVNLYDEQGRHVHGLPSATVSPARSVEAIAADIQRRVIAPARPLLVQHYLAAAKAAHEATHRAQVIDRLCEILGPIEYSAARYSHMHGWRNFNAKSETDLTGHGYRDAHYVNIRVHSLDCLLMIARLVAEDQRLAPHASS